MNVLPSAILFVCNLNQVRSPMAEGIMKRFHGARVFVDSAGVDAGVQDPIMIEVMREIGIDMSRHKPKTLADIAPESFEVMMALSPAARAQAESLTRYVHCDLRSWDIPDPTRAEGSRAARLAAYREVRERISQKILELYPREDH